LIWNQLDQNAFSKDKIMVFANLSIPEKIRTIEFPQILENAKFKSILVGLLQNTHDEIKNNKNSKTAIKNKVQEYLTHVKMRKSLLYEAKTIHHKEITDFGAKVA
jgi:hypothetical protein